MGIFKKLLIGAGIVAALGGGIHKVVNTIYWRSVPGVRLTYDKHIETAACFVGDNRVVYTRLDRISYGKPCSHAYALYMVKIQNNEATKPEKIFDLDELEERKGYGIKGIMDMCDWTAICGVGNDKVVFAAPLAAGTFGVFVYNIKTKELKQILSDFPQAGHSQIQVGSSKDEERVMVGHHKQLHYSIPVNADTTYTPNNLPPVASKEDVRHIEAVYKELYKSLDYFPYGTRKGMTIRKKLLRSRGIKGLIWKVTQSDLILTRGKNEN